MSSETAPMQGSHSGAGNAGRNAPPGGQDSPGAPPPSGRLSETTGDGLAVASLVLGVVACLFFWMMPICGLFALLSIFMGRLSQRRAARHAAGQSQPGGAPQRLAKGWANAGITLSFAGLIICIASYAACFVVTRKFAADGKKEYGRAIKELEADPEFGKNVKELREELDKLDEKLPDETDAVGEEAASPERPGAPAKEDTRGALENDAGKENGAAKASAVKASAVKASAVKASAAKASAAKSSAAKSSAAEAV